MWLNGGPGASSVLAGALSELGPYFLNSSSLANKTTASVPDLYENPYSWHTIANLVFLESPANVGFSHCSRPDCRWDDESTAKANYGAVVQFFDRFPEFESSEFFVAGESYAGVYVPTLVEQIRQHARDVAAPRIKLRGMAIGNGIIGHNDTFPGGGLGVARIETMHRVRECHRARCPPTSSNRARCCGCSMALSARSCG